MIVKRAFAAVVANSAGADYQLLTEAAFANSLADSRSAIR